MTTGVNCVPSCPAIIRKIADSFKDLVGPEHYKPFVAALCGYLFGISSFSDMARFLFFSPSVTSLGRLFDERGLPAKLNKRQRKMVKRLLAGKKSKFLWALDDTLLPHYGEEIWGVYWWFDHSINASVRAHRLMVLGIVDTEKNIFIPVKWEILHRGQIDSKTERERGWEIGLRLLKEALDEKFPKLPLVADSWFAGEEFFQKLTSLGLKFVLEIRHNRKIKNHGKKTIMTSVKIFFQTVTRVKIFFLNRAKWACSAVLVLKDSNLKLKVLAVSNKKGLASEPFAYYVCNELTWDESKIWSIARYRWAIEVQFRELKQLFALGKAAVRSKQSVEISLSMSMIALTVVRQFQYEKVDANKNQKVKLIPASEIVQNIKLESLDVFVSKLASQGERIFLLKFRHHFSKANLRNRPTVEFQKTG